MSGVCPPPPNSGFAGVNFSWCSRYHHGRLELLRVSESCRNWLTSSGRPSGAVQSISSDSRMSLASLISTCLFVSMDSRPSGHLWRCLRVQRARFLTFTYVRSFGHQTRHLFFFPGVKQDLLNYLRWSPVLLDSYQLANASVVRTFVSLFLSLSGASASRRKEGGSTEWSWPRLKRICINV